VKVSACDPVAWRDSLVPGAFLIERSGGPGSITVHYTISGDAIPGTDYVSLSGSVKLGFGQTKALVKIVPIDDPGATTDPAVKITIDSSRDYEISSRNNAEVAIFKKRALSVRDFGAVGDGVADDSAAIQDALEALESSTDRNTLHFPAGIYRLNTYVNAPDGYTSYYRILKFGETDLAGRDILIEGETGAILYSTVSPIRSHILQVYGTFRSLHFRNLELKKDPTVLGESKYQEPNGVDGVALMMVDRRDIESVDFENCIFFNCHGAVSTHGRGYDIRGKLHLFKMTGCQILNPWGANSVASSRMWGGGQQVNINSWVGDAIYENNVFDGGSRLFEEPAMNPLGRKKDGSHFGSPLRLYFRNNTVKDMRIESVFHVHEPFMANTQSVLVLPDTGETASFSVTDHPTTWVPGQVIAIRGPLGDGTTKSVSLVVVDYNPVGRTVTVRNDDLNDYEIAGIEFSAYKPIYLQSENSEVAWIEDNVIKADLKGDQRAQSGIVSSTAARIRNNYIEGFTSGVLIYGNARTPLYPGSKGVVVENNVVVSSDASTNPRTTTYGVQSWGPDEIIRHNFVMTPVSTHFMGIAVRGENAWIEENTVVAMEVVRNGYGSPLRSVGIGLANRSKWATVIRNTTCGFDVGTGTIEAYLSSPHYVIDHRSVNDELPVDPRGVLEP
jgi:hypothetical protein